MTFKESLALAVSDVAVYILVAYFSSQEAAVAVAAAAFLLLGNYQVWRGAPAATLCLQLLWVCWFAGWYMELINTL